MIAGLIRAQLIAPLEGIENKDWFVVNYVDRDTSSGDSTDYHCGNLTYDGHWGTDFVLRDFRQMDDSVYAVAAASGRVYFTHDGDFDRSKQADTGGYGNFVSIDHGDSLFTLYAHLRKNSLLVQVGDSVTQGQRIALVGSSGKSLHPHVHFEVYKDGWIVDPFGLQCDGFPSVESMFNVAPVYHNELQYISSSVAPDTLHLDDLREDPRQTHITSGDSYITYWVHGLSIDSGDVTRADWYEPSGTLWHSDSFTFDVGYRYWWYYTYIYGPVIQKNIPFGSWHVKSYVNGNLFDSVSFTIGELGVEDGRKVELLLSPNPARDYLLVPTPLKDVKIFDILGKQVQTRIAMADALRIEWDQLRAGVYYLSGKNEAGKELILKFMVE